MKVVCIIGLPGSGKSEALRVPEEMGIPTFNMGDVITKIEPKRLGIKKVTEDIEYKIRTDIRKEHGPAAVAVITARELEKSGADFIVIGGLHSFAELEYLKERFKGDFYLVTIEASYETRARRIGTRQERPESRPEFERREERYRKQFDVHRLVEQADFVIPNEGTREELRSAVRELLEKLRK